MCRNFKATKSIGSGGQRIAKRIPRRVVAVIGEVSIWLPPRRSSRDGPPLPVPGHLLTWRTCAYRPSWTGGVDATLRKSREASTRSGRGGCSTIFFEFEQPPRLCRQWLLRNNFFRGTATPPVQEGRYAHVRQVCYCPCSRRGAGISNWTTTRLSPQLNLLRSRDIRLRI